MDDSVTPLADDTDLDVPVLIVGGGPAGLTAVMELARRRVEGLLVERRGFTTRFPRAHLLNAHDGDLPRCGCGGTDLCRVSTGRPVAQGRLAYLAGRAGPADELASVVGRLLRPNAQFGSRLAALEGMTEAGEALRVTSGRKPQLFSSTD